MASQKYKYHEYDIRDRFREAGFECERVPCSGNARGFKGDLILRVYDTDLIIDVAYRSKKYAFPKILFSKIEKGKIFCLGNEVFLMDLYTFISLLKERSSIEFIYVEAFDLGVLNKVLRDKITKYDLAIFKTNRVRNVCIRRERFEDLIQGTGGYYGWVIED